MTDRRELLIRMRNILAELYDDEASAKRVAEDVGLDWPRIERAERMLDYWHSILREAERQGKLEALLALATTEYPGQGDLAGLREAYQPATAGHGAKAEEAGAAAAAAAAVSVPGPMGQPAVRGRRWLLPAVGLAVVAVVALVVVLVLKPLLENRAYIARFDFEENTTMGWHLRPENQDRDTLAVSNELASSGKHALKLDVQLEPHSPNENIDNHITWVQTTWTGPKPGGKWSIDIYIPHIPQGTTLWAQLYSYLHSSSGWIDNSPGENLKAGWNTISANTTDWPWDTNTYVIGVQLGVEDGPYAGPIYFDNMRISRSAP